MKNNIWEQYKIESCICSTHKGKVYKAKNNKIGNMS